MKFVFEVRSGLRQVTSFNFEVDINKIEAKELFKIEQWFNEKTNIRVHILEDVREKEK